MILRCRLCAVLCLLIISGTLKIQAQSFVDYNFPGGAGTVKFTDIPEFFTSLSDDSLNVHTASEFFGANELAVIVVELNGVIGNDQEVLLGLALDYMSYLNTTLDLSYADQPTIEQNETSDNAHSEFSWSGTDLDLYTYEFKCLINSNALIILLTVDSGDLPYDIKTTFLNGCKLN